MSTIEEVIREQLRTEEAINDAPLEEAEKKRRIALTTRSVLWLYRRVYRRVYRMAYRRIYQRTRVAHHALRVSEHVSSSVSTLARAFGTRIALSIA